MGCSPVHLNKKSNTIKSKVRGSILELKSCQINTNRKSVNLHLNGKSLNRLMIVPDCNNPKIITETNFDPFLVYGNPLFVKEGRYDSIYIVTQKTTGLKRIMKKFHKKKKVEFTEDDGTNQVEILKNLTHPNIIKGFEVYTYNNYIYMIYEYCQGGTLLDVGEHNSNFSENMCRDIMIQIFSAVNYCHNKGVVHRDLCPEHIVLDKKEDGYNIKIINFGSFLGFDNLNHNLIKSHKEMLTMGYKSITNPYFSSPEVKNWNNYESEINTVDNKSDIWSCGVIMYLLLSGEGPFNNSYINELNKNANGKEYKTTSSCIIKKVITDNNILSPTKSKLNGDDASGNSNKPPILKFNGDIWENISSEAKYLISKLLQFNPRSRITASEAGSNSFFNESSKLKHTKTTKKQFNMLINNMRHFTKRYRLNDAISSFMIHHGIKRDDLNNIKKLFHSIDINHNGRISKKEGIEVLSKIISPYQAENDANKIFENGNKDKNDGIEFEDFIKATINRDKFFNDKNLRIIFDFIDKDHNGNINKYELKNFFLGNNTIDYLMASDEIYGNVIKEIDANGDGEINFYEFKKMMMK